MQDSEQCLPLTRAIVNVAVLLHAHLLNWFPMSSAHLAYLIHLKVRFRITRNRRGPQLWLCSNFSARRLLRISKAVAPIDN